MGVHRYIFILIAGLSIILAACSIEPNVTPPNASTVEGTEMPMTDLPVAHNVHVTTVNVALSISKLPVLNETVGITCTVVPQKDATGSTVQIELSEGAILIDGYLEWQGDLKADTPVSLSAQIAFKKTGRHKVEATVLYMVDGMEVWGGDDAIYMEIGTENSTFGWKTAPAKVTRVPDKWSVIETSLEVSHAPKLNEPARLFITILSPVDMSGLTAEIIFYKGVELLEGAKKQPVDLKAGIPVHFSATIVFTETGNHSITADVAELVKDVWHSSPQDTIYFNIGIEESTYSRNL